MAGAAKGGRDLTGNVDGGSLYTLITVVSWIFMASHSMLEPGGDWLMVVQFICCLTRLPGHASC